jgi:hypothetical protein
MILCRFVEKVTVVRALQSDLAAVLGKAREADFAVQKLKTGGCRMAVRSPLPKVGEHTERHHRAPGDALRLHDRRGQPGKNRFRLDRPRRVTETSGTNLTPGGAVPF